MILMMIVQEMRVLKVLRLFGSCTYCCISLDIVYVSWEKGSIEPSCGTLTTPCKYLAQAVANCVKGGEIYVKGVQAVSSEIEIIKDVSIVGNHGATFTGNTSDGVVFKIKQLSTFHLTNPAL